MIIDDDNRGDGNDDDNDRENRKNRNKNREKFRKKLRDDDDNYRDEQKIFDFQSHQKKIQKIFLSIDMSQIGC